MRTHTLRVSVLSFIVSTALMAPIAASAQEERPASPAQSPAASKTVNGKVTAKGANSLTIDSTKFVLTDSTTFMKNGVSIKLDDIKIGDEVRVAVSEEAGTLHATSIEVLPGEK